MTRAHHDGILIIDFGSQYTQLIARRVREAHVYCEIHPPSRTVDWIREWKPKGIILSGGPNSVYGDSVPTADPELLELGTPVLGLCYGMQLMAHLSGGKVTRASRRELPYEAMLASGSTCVAYETLRDAQGRLPLLRRKQPHGWALARRRCAGLGWPRCWWRWRLAYTPSAELRAGGLRVRNSRRI